MFKLPFSPAAYVEEIEAIARADGWSLRYLNLIGEFRRPWLQRAALAPKKSPAPRFYLSTGIHGDELSGPFALLEMLRRPDFFAAVDVTIFPLLNPHGLAANLRLNAEELDLNRDYRALKSSEINGHVAVLNELGRFDAAIFLHEDYEGIGAYLYELNETMAPELGARIIDAMARHVPIDERPIIEEVPAQRGVISRKNLIEIYGPIEDLEEWAEAAYLSIHHTHVSYTTETPLPFPLEQRIAAQIAAVETLLDALNQSHLTF